MKLRAKLLLSLSALLFGYVVIVFFVPTIVVVRDIEDVGKTIRNLVIKKQKELVRDQEILLEDIFQQIRTSLNTSLLLTSQSEETTKILEHLNGKKHAPVWHQMVQLAGEDPNLGFIQVSAADQTLVLKPAEAALYPAVSTPVDGNNLAIQIEGKKYLGIKLSKEFQSDQGSHFFALLDWDEARAQEKILEKEEKAIDSKLNELHNKLDAEQVFNEPQNAHAKALKWVEKMEMIRLLTPLFETGIVIEGVRNRVPEGIARLSPDGKMVAIFSKNIVSTRPAFDAADYYTKHAPLSNAPPLAQGSFFIYDKNLQHIYLANVIDLNGAYLTYGAPVDDIARNFAIWSNKPALITVGDQLWMGFDQKGERFSQAELELFAKEKIIEKQMGVFDFQGNQYFFANIAEFEVGRIGIYELAIVDGKNSIGELSLGVAYRLAWKISFQIFVISVLVILLILLIAGRLVLRLAVRPVVKLAAITDQVVKGQYEDIQWPDMGKRKDEVATLTHSFEQMVHGLMEKEKIRSVLDKVVSKDVANEILKSKIQLGGEDRNVSVMFADIRDFTHISESLTPQQTIELLNSCMTKITQVIEGEGGVIDKFVGDAVMAIYGAPTVVEDHALRSVSSGILISRAIKNWNDEREKQGLERVEMGIGINTGVVTAGNMGAVDRLNYTVLGKNVNIASRLCSIAKPSQLIISEQTYNEPHVKDSFYIEPLPPVMLKGFSESFNIYHVVDFKWES